MTTSCSGALPERRSASGSAAATRTGRTNAGTGVTLSDAAGKIQLPEFLPDTPEVRSDLLDYFYEVERFDRDLGLILAALERAGELDNTIVIVTSDNGLPFPRAKATVYDGGVRVPLAIRWPGVAKPGTTVDALVSLDRHRADTARGCGCGGRLDDDGTDTGAAAAR